MRKILIVGSSFFLIIAKVYGTDVDFGWSDIQPKSTVINSGSKVEQTYFAYDIPNKNHLENKLELMYKEIVFLRSYNARLQKQLGEVDVAIGKVEESYRKEIFQREQLLTLYQEYVKTIGELAKKNTRDRGGFLKVLEDSIKVFGVYKILDK